MNKREKLDQRNGHGETDERAEKRSGRRSAERKKKRRQIRACLMLAAVVLAGGFLLGAGRLAINAVADAAAADPTDSAFFARQSPEADTEQQGQLVSDGEGAAGQTPSQTPPKTGGGTSGGSAAAAKDDWNMILVNPWNKIPEGYEVKLTQLSNGQSVDERCYPSLQDMMDDCRAAGLNPLICSSFRTQEKQERLFNNQVNKLIGRGYSQEDAKKEAGRAVAVPGTSEHQLGLAVDIVDVANQNLDESQEKTAVQKWLMENSWKYGFILRYPNDKSDVTGIIYEPWHYRYVGKDVAGEIYEHGVCLEEYLDGLSGDPLGH